MEERDGSTSWESVRVKKEPRDDTEHVFMEVPVEYERDPRVKEEPLDEDSVPYGGAEEPASVYIKNELVLEPDPLQPDSSYLPDERLLVKSESDKCHIKSESKEFDTLDDQQSTSSPTASDAGDSSQRTSASSLRSRTRKRFSLKSTIANHLEKHMATYSCDMCPQKFTKYNKFCQHKKTHSNICDICNKSLSTRSALKLHISRHTGEKPYVCKYCDKRFKHEASISTHITYVHEKARKYKCEICNQEFSRDSLLKTHQQRAHAAENSESCDLCDMQFLKGILLTIHKNFAHVNNA